VVEFFELHAGGLGVNPLGWLPLLHASHDSYWTGHHNWSLQVYTGYHPRNVGKCPRVFNFFCDVFLGKNVQHIPTIRARNISLCSPMVQ